MTDRANMLCILHILEEYSDADHILTTKDIQSKMKSLYDKTVDRRTIYSAVQALTEFGVSLSGFEDNGVGYYLDERNFTAAEVRILIDAVFSCEYISKKQTEELLEKLRGLMSCHDRQRYNYTNIVTANKKSSNPQVSLNIEMLDEAISRKSKVSFTYLDYDYDKSLKPRRSEAYVGNPYMMICDSGMYYLVAITNRHPGIGYYRIDMMKDLKLLDEKIDISKKDANLDSVKKVVYAFSGEPVSAHLHCDKAALRYVIERFGKDDVMIQKNADGSFEAFLKAPPLGLTYWALQYLDSVEVVSPESVRQNVIKILKENKYGV